MRSGRKPADGGGRGGFNAECGAAIFRPRVRFFGKSLRGNFGRTQQVLGARRIFVQRAARAVHARNFGTLLRRVFRKTGSCARNAADVFPPSEMVENVRKKNRGRGGAVRSHRLYCVVSCGGVAESGSRRSRNGRGRVRNRGCGKRTRHSIR